MLQRTALWTEPLDTLRSVETPEGITLNLRPAGPVVRGLAWFVDTLIRYASLGVLFMVLAFLGEAGVGLFLIAAFLLEWFYPVLFELRYDGATPGKRVYGLKVINDNGAPVDFSASMIRNLLRVADFLPLLYGAGLISMLFNQNFKRLGDLAAGTIVVHRDPVHALPEPPPGPSRQPPTPLAPAERRLIIDFAERSSRLSPERQAELAAILEPLTGATGRPTTEELLAYARWLLGTQR